MTLRRLLCAVRLWLQQTVICAHEYEVKRQLLCEVCRYCGKRTRGWDVSPSQALADDLRAQVEAKALQRQQRSATVVRWKRGA